EKGTRLDGRSTTDVRAIWSEVGYLPGTHGSAVFTRGETQSLTSVTLGTKLDAQNIDGAFMKGKQKFMLHYNFPPFSTGEARPIRSVSRREIGHGNLALRALLPMVPDNFPYTIRVVSDILESNGSSSMATVCAGSLALMDAGVKMKKPVSGIAMGLIYGDDQNWAVLSDILGDEDALGDMDFKITGTADGITACQMDIKVDGLKMEVLSKALEQAKAGRLHIADEMAKTLTSGNEELKPNAPRIESITIPKDMIGAIIGPGGKIIQEIQAETETTIVIEEVNNQGVVEVFASNADSLNAAMGRIKGIVAVPEVGEVYKGKVKAVAAYGAFVEIIPGKDGLLHISEIAWDRVDKTEDHLEVGQEIEVKLIGLDPKTGKLRLSRKVLLDKPKND
ncbi:MAG: polyribonucleotide nucleotidyltransferase, partial [Dokdonia sp.]